MLEIAHPTQILPLRVLHPSLHHVFIAQVERVFQIVERYYEPRIDGRTSLLIIPHRLKGLLELIPLKLIGQSYHRMIGVEKRGQLNFEEVRVGIVSFVMTAFHPLNLQGFVVFDSATLQKLAPF